jgi:hypothetical protein
MLCTLLCWLALSQQQCFTSVLSTLLTVCPRLPMRHSNCRSAVGQVLHDAEHARLLPSHRTYKGVPEGDGVLSPVYRSSADHVMGSTSKQHASCSGSTANHDYCTSTPGACFSIHTTYRTSSSITKLLYG